MTVNSRAEFFDTISPNGSLGDIVGIYRHNSSSAKIGLFDAELIGKLPTSLKWIAHNGAGYDQIDIDACKDRGAPDPHSRILSRWLIVSLTFVPGSVVSTFCFQGLLCRILRVQWTMERQRRLCI